MSSEHANIHYGRGSSANAVHFYQLIQPHHLQEQELKIHRSFAERYWNRVSNPISLKLPNGSEWKFFWEKRGDDIWLLKNCWTNLARSLRSGDQLVFKYKGESDFDVIIFDDSALEIDYSSIGSCNNVDDEEEEESDHGDADECVVEIVNENQKPSQQPVKEEEMKSCREHESSSNPHLQSKRKINIIDSDATHQNVSRVNKKKAKKCSTTGSFKETASDSHPDEKNPNFTIKLAPTYAQADRLRIPSKFSKEHLNEMEGTTATINCVGEERTWKVKLRLDVSDGSFKMNNGWRSFSQEHNLQVGDVCKFEMTQRKPVAFIVTITRAKYEPDPGPFQGSEHEPNQQQHQDKLEKLAVDKSRSCIKTQGSEHEPNKLHQDKLEKLALDKPVSSKKIHGSADSDKQNTYLVYASSLLKLSVPMELIKRYNICNGKTLELKVGEQSWLVKVRYLPQLDFWRFSEGWLEFVLESNLKIGDNCLFEMIDEKNLVFKVSIVLDV